MYIYKKKSHENKIISVKITNILKAIIREILKYFILFLKYLFLFFNFEQCYSQNIYPSHYLRKTFEHF